MAAGSSLSDLDRCSIDHWYPALRAVTIRTKLLPLSADFVRYLLADNVYVPDAASQSEDEGELSSHESSSDDGEDQGDAQGKTPRFRELEAAIGSAIQAYGGHCFPKLNWSAPTDAAWMLGGSLKCASARDVMLLLKSSDRISHDLCDARRAYGGVNGSDEAGVTDKWVLALRRWSNLKPDHEFRCFCSDGGARLLAACQRDRFSHYDFLAPARPQLLALLESFLERVGRLARPDRSQTSSADDNQSPTPVPRASQLLLPHHVVVDCYIDASERVYLLDVAPFHDATDPLLFEWDELRALAVAADNEAALDRGLTFITSPFPTRVEFERYRALAPGEQEAALSKATAALSVQTSVDIASAQSMVGLRASKAPELRLVEGGQGVAPSASMYYGMPHDLREAGASDLSALIEAARQASGAAEVETVPCTGD